MLGAVGMGLPFIMAWGQIPSGAWRDHLPYNEGRRLARAGEKVYCATNGGGLFSYKLTDNSIKKHSKVNGLSDAGISTVGYAEEAGVLFIGYTNGNIDLVRNDSVYNIPDIKRKSISGDKIVLNIFFQDDLAYLACGFGIVVCDIRKREIKDTYMFGDGGSQIRVNDITSDGNNLFAATAQGIYSAEISSPNLVDFNAWHRLSFLPAANEAFRFVANYNGKLYTVYNNGATGFDNIIEVSGESWEPWTYSENDHFDYLGTQNGNLVVCSGLRTKIYNSSEQLVRDVSSYYAKHALYDSDGLVWYADPVSGMVRIDLSGAGTVICPDGPAYIYAGDMETEEGRVWVGGGTEASKWSNAGAYSFIGEDWANYNNTTVPGLEGVLNISEIAIDPSDNNHIIGGSYGYGIAEFRNNALAGVFDETNSVLTPVPGYGHGYVLVTGTDIGSDGTLWISTSLSDMPVYRRSPGGDLETVPLAFKGFGLDTRIGDILVTSAGDIWLLIQNNGILVFHETDGGSLEERFFTVRNQVPDLLDRVYSIAEDIEGSIWVGTNKGPVVYFDPSEIFEKEDVTGYQPEIPRNDGTNFVDLLLSTEKINCIAVDGANRKWFTTEKSGVFLVSDDGKVELHHFTEANSPLLSDNVQTATVNDKTGEVFFGTDKGIVSFRGQATEGSDNFGNVYVFPNPVRENYEGDITITGLVKDVNVKITDISGNLVYETTALGGQAIWNGMNFHGERVHTGVYLVFCTNDDGTSTHVAKMLFIH